MVRPLVLYDGECGFCRWIVRRFGWVLRKRGFLFVRLQQPWVARRYAIPPQHLLDEFRVVLGQGRIRGGGDGLAELGRVVRPWRFVWIVGSRAVGRRLLRRLYAWIDRHREVIGARFGLR